LAAAAILKCEEADAARPARNDKEQKVEAEMAWLAQPAREFVRRAKLTVVTIRNVWSERGD
jgi:hypothetical protein